MNRRVLTIAVLLGIAGLSSYFLLFRVTTTTTYSLDGPPGEKLMTMGWPDPYPEEVTPAVGAQEGPTYHVGGVEIAPVFLVIAALLTVLLSFVAAWMTLKHLRGSARRRALAAMGLALGVAAAYLGYHGYYLIGSGRYAEFEDIQARLRQIPGVELLDASGNEDVTFEIEGFTIDVEGRGVIAFGPLDLDSFEGSDHLYVETIGGYEVIVVMEGFIGVSMAETGDPVRSTGWGVGIDVGPEGAFSSFFPFPLSSVRDVIDRYDEICSELDGWPLQPEYGTFQDEEGTHYYYSVRDPSSDEDWIHPSELERLGPAYMPPR